MKTAVILLLLCTLPLTALAQLNGVFGGRATGIDANGQQVNQIARFTFSHGTLVAFDEAYMFAADTVPCDMSATAHWATCCSTRR